MSPLFWPLTGAIALSGAFDLVAIATKRRSWRYLFKPGTMLLIIGFAATGLAGAGTYGYLVIAGLVLSVLGDIFLVMPSDRFLPGLLAFFAAHLCYIAAFSNRVTPGLTEALIAAALLAFGLFTYRRLRLGVLEQGGRRMLPPVGLYITAILLMVMSAVTTRELAVIAGALLFCLSDFILAWSRFVSRKRWTDLGVISTYFTAQYLIALSLVLR